MELKNFDVSKVERFLPCNMRFKSWDMFESWDRSGHKIIVIKWLTQEAFSNEDAQVFWEEIKLKVNKLFNLFPEYDRVFVKLACRDYPEDEDLRIYSKNDELASALVHVNCWKEKGE